jgi:hypothetical protein
MGRLTVQRWRVSEHSFEISPRIPHKVYATHLPTQSQHSRYLENDTFLKMY